ncbi:MAG: TIR domain-containing protein [Anaerolineaceae bacterium]|nr:TIR domain-containing protein [Anaerolineaceae bacterium]
MQYHIFISYSHEDADIKKRMRATFRSAGLSVWSDTELRPGTHAWSIAIEEALENAGCVVVLMSPASKDSQWVSREISYALAQDIPVIPVLVSGTESTAIPIKLIETQYVDIRTHYERGMGQLILTIKNTLFKDATNPSAPTQSLETPEFDPLRPRTWWSRPELWLGGAALLVVLVLLAVAVIGPTLTPQPTPTPTSRAVVVEPTQTNSPTTSPEDTVTSRPTNTPTLTSTPTDTRTPTPATPIAQPFRNVFVRQGPGVTYPIVATIAADKQVVIQGISEDNGWYEVVLTDGSVAWLIASQVDTFGNLRRVPLALPPTNTPVPTRTPTATLTDTLTATPSPTDTATLPASATPEPSATHTPAPATPTTPPSATPTERPTDAATATLVPSDTLTHTPTPTDTDTPQPTATDTEIPSPTPTPAPEGAFPYFNTFNQGNALDGWSYDPAIWALQTEAGHGMVLEGTGTGRSVLDSPAIILGESNPDWLETDNLVIRFSFNIHSDSASAGARVVYRASDEDTYNALELLPGTAILRRGVTGSNTINRLDERVVRTRTGLPISGNTWHDVVLWIESDRLDIYLDGELLTPIEDISPQLRAGQILLQVIGNKPVAFDNLTIDRINPASTHFTLSSLPSAWLTSGAQLTTAGGDQYLRLSGSGSAQVTETFEDFEAFCRIWNESGSYQIRLRQGDDGAVTLDYNVFGTLTVNRLDDDGIPTPIGQPVANFHGRSNWVDLHIALVDEDLTLYANGKLAFTAAIPDAPESGSFVFETTSRGDVLRIDDCLFLTGTP